MKLKTLFASMFLMTFLSLTASAQWYCQEDRDCSDGDFCATDGHCQTRTGPGMCPSTCGCPGAGPECIPPVDGGGHLAALKSKGTLTFPKFEASKVTPSMIAKVVVSPVKVAKEPEVIEVVAKRETTPQQ